MSGYVWHPKPPPPPDGPPVNPCACGCGEEVAIAWRTDRRHGQVKGQPLRYVHGHNQRKRAAPPPDRDARHG